MSGSMEFHANDCPLDDDRLIEAAAAGLLPIREGRGLVWIIAPRGLTARRLADPRQERPKWLQSFRLTFADRLRHFVARHTQRALGRRAAENLRLKRRCCRMRRMHGIGRRLELSR
jgi:hypothetical protein